MNSFNREKLDPGDLRRMLDYDPDTGILTWKTRAVVSHGDKVFNGRFAGKPAGCVSDGEIVINIRLNGRQTGFRAHRIAWAIQTGSWPVGDIDQKDAAQAHDAAALLLHGNFAKTNAALGLL